MNRRWNVKAPDLLGPGHVAKTLGPAAAGPHFLVGRESSQPRINTRLCQGSGVAGGLNTRLDTPNPLILLFHLLLLERGQRRVQVESPLVIEQVQVKEQD